jgi:hypothetical protein
VLRSPLKSHLQLQIRSSGFLGIGLVTVTETYANILLTPSEFTNSRYPLDRIAWLGDKKIAVAHPGNAQSSRNTCLKLIRAWPSQFSSFSIGVEQDFSFDDILPDHCSPLSSRVPSNVHTQVCLKSNQVCIYPAFCPSFDDHPCTLTQG